MDQLLHTHQTTHASALAHTHAPRPAKRKVEADEYEEYDLVVEVEDDEDRPPKRRRANSLPALPTEVERVPTSAPAAQSQLSTDAGSSQADNTPGASLQITSAPMATHDVLPALAVHLSPLTQPLPTPSRPTDPRLRSPSTPLARTTPTRRVAHVPSLTPLITRETLKELDLEAILRNPQLRHDLLFDPGLQFRPTSGRKKRDLTDKYWQAVQIEVETGCACTSFDDRGRRLPCVCGALLSRPTSSRTLPSRIPPLVSELCHVLQSVVHSASADPTLIAQELRHGVFDSRGVFKNLGSVLKQHCAPMRDRAVEMMVAVAARPGGGVRAVRMCFEILELMKLDIANHQLQALRPYLFETAIDFELKTFQERHERGLLTLTTTQEWLRKAHSTFASPPPTMQLLSNALTSLIFSPPATVSTPPPPTTTPLSQRLPHIAPPPGYPETLYLDHGRLAGLTADAADLGVLYSVLMLFRQLVYSGGRKVSLEDSVVDRVKREIWEVGPVRLGLCFSGRKPGDDEEWEKWRSGMRDVVLQVAVRAEQVRSGTCFSSSKTPALPDSKMLAMLESWTETNLRPDAALAKLFKGRLTKAVEQVVNSSRKKQDDEKEVVAAGLEPLMPEVRHLGERIAKLVSFHGRVYRGLYEAEGFLA
ncbi:T-complex protein [Rhizoctonia solani AG-3 Rhs1AP]|uniref:T-complex protein n=2 Tax=Rhizoctonia solani AG-3 TaxID=1086053 RepID=A0A074S3J6_9AGAM|nr:T-complex protein [Rhizoctonia solani AG-3 Rhs1AP]KEP53941.1 T-complex protein [Rhizoctonia solani 123E]